MTIRPLTLDDIADQRAYERERVGFRREVIAVKRRRRVSIGPVVTLTFENRLTMRFQVQEMARAEKLITDSQIQRELDVYNRLLPAPGELSATIFLELTSEEQLRNWLPRLVGIEGSVLLEIGEGTSRHLVRSVPEAEHETHLTRPEVTSAVHYVRFPFTSGAQAAFHIGPVRLVVDHAEYSEGWPGVAMSDASRAELSRDLAGD
ncbi:MAG TPA: DUF3501 family protein [Acidimicrobiales bacterium]